MGLAADISGSSAGEVFFVQFASGGSLDTRGLLLAAIIIAAVGVLDDMTVTQAATVEQLVARSGLRAGALWHSALRIGRAHVAATVNTLFMAYEGAALPGIVLLAVATEPTILSCRVLDRACEHDRGPTSWPAPDHGDRDRPHRSPPVTATRSTSDMPRDPGRADPSGPPESASGPRPP